MNNYSYTNKQK